DKNGVLATDLKFIGDKNSIRLDPEMIFKPEIVEKMVDSTYIHNHPFNMPLSSNDIVQMAGFNIKKMLACTRNGGYSFLERTGTLTNEQHQLFHNKAFKLLSKEISKIKQLSKTRGMTDIERLNQLQDWRYQEFGKIAKEFNLRFENNIDRLTHLDDIPSGIFRINPFSRLIDNILVSCKNVTKS
ncbi:MAG: hypothetical protein LBJ74_01125, partial [Heliobacteriaceae bacterium]|nr:hypothetical protein [Heliobacteriaceae bacterium]